VDTGSFELRRGIFTLRSGRSRKHPARPPRESPYFFLGTQLAGCFDAPCMLYSRRSTGCGSSRAARGMVQGGDGASESKDKNGFGPCVGWEW